MTVTEIQCGGADRSAAALAGAVAIVTGAGAIGTATAGALQRRGASVVLVDIDEERIARSSGSSSPATRPERLGLTLDVRSERDMATMAETVLARFGRIDALITTAGVLRGHAGLPRPVHETDLDAWQLVVETNLTGVYLSNRAVLPSMLRRRSGQIINVASTSGQEGRALDAPYCASKFGVIGLTEALAKETAGRGVRVNAVLPGAVKSELWQQNGGLAAPPDALAPDRVAELIAYLLCLPPDMQLWKPVILPSGVTGVGSVRRRPRRGLA